MGPCTDISGEFNGEHGTDQLSNMIQTVKEPHSQTQSQTIHYRLIYGIISHILFIQFYK